jgi:hypothetical protein
MASMGMVLPGQNQGEDEEQQQLKLAMLAAQAQQQQAANQPPVPPMPAANQPESMAASVPPTPQPNVNLAHATFASQPAASDVQRAQSNLDDYQNRPMWRKMLGPALIAGASALGAHSYGGRQLQAQGDQDMQELVKNQEGRRQSLIQQLQFAKGEQQSQYEADQRNRQQDIMMQGNNQTKTLQSQILANSRLGVAGVNAGSREAVADTNVQGRKDVTGMQDTSREKIAGEQVTGRMEVAKVNAQAALSRFLAGEGRTDARQANSFGHTDNKPTADEDRRADLTEAMMGYADMLGDIAQRRPELFGPLSGRVTQGRQLIGSDDPDVANLKFLREQLGITQMGAHSLRSAQAIGPIADSLVNSFHNSPEAVLSTIDMAKKGVSSFLNPVRPTVGGVGPNPAPGQPQPTRTPLKSRVTAPPRPAGVPAGAVWNQQGNQGKGSWKLPAQ